jgi:hypothetical protein
MKNLMKSSNFSQTPFSFKSKQPKNTRSNFTSTWRVHSDDENIPTCGKLKVTGKSFIFTQKPTLQTQHMGKDIKCE